MSDPFLSLPGAKKRKRRSRFSNRQSLSFENGPGNTRARLRRDRESSSSSDGDEDEIGPGNLDGADSKDHILDDDEEQSEDFETREETGPERRLRLAKQYLDSVRSEMDDLEFDAAAVDRDLIAERLKEDVAETKGRVYRYLASELSFDPSLARRLPHKSTLTGITTYAHHLYTSSKDGSITKWDLTPLPGPPKRVFHIKPGRKKDRKFLGHTQDILTLAVSGDGKYLATAGKDKKICIWDTLTMKHLTTFRQHRDQVMGLSFRRGTNQLYSASADRTVKLWSLNEMTYLETLFGHQDSITSIAGFSSERCVSVGARDRSARVWKIVDETQLVFRFWGDPGAILKKKVRATTAGNVIGEEQKDIYPEGSMDCVAVIDEQHFVTGSDNGNITLWSLQKKKPQFIVPLAHGLAEPPTPSQHSADKNPCTIPPSPPQPRWIMALASIPYSDLFISGSWDGTLCLWKLSADMKYFEKSGKIDLGVKGIVNGICVEEIGKRGADGVRIYAAVGKECRLGRWIRVKGGKNCAVIIHLPKESH